MYSALLEDKSKESKPPSLSLMKSNGLNGISAIQSTIGSGGSNHFEFDINSIASSKIRHKPKKTGKSEAGEQKNSPAIPADQATSQSFQKPRASDQKQAPVFSDSEKETNPAPPSPISNIQSVLLRNDEASDAQIEEFFSSVHWQNIPQIIVETLKIFVEQACDFRHPREKFLRVPLFPYCLSDSQIQ